MCVYIYTIGLQKFRSHVTRLTKKVTLRIADKEENNQLNIKTTKFFRAVLSFLKVRFIGKVFCPVQLKKLSRCVHARTWSSPKRKWTAPRRTKYNIALQHRYLIIGFLFYDNCINKIVAKFSTGQRRKKKTDFTEIKKVSYGNGDK